MRIFAKAIENRKTLAERIAAITKTEINYTRVPRFAYEVGAFSVEKDGKLVVEDGATEGVIAVLKAEGLIGEEIIPDSSSFAQVASYVPVEEMDTIASLLGDEEDEDLEELAAPTSSASDASVPASSEPASSEEETVETEAEEASPSSGGADTGNTTEEAEVETAVAPEAEAAEEVEANEGFPKDLAVALPLTSHTAHSIANLVCMIYTRGSLLSKATGGNFKVNKELVDFILEEVEMATKDELIASINGQLEEEDKVLEGLKLEADRITFNGFKNVPDFETCRVFTRLAENMNKMALTQKRVQVKEVTEPNDKYSLRIWLVRLGMSGGEYKEDRRILMKRLTGHSAFRTEADKEKWILARKKAKGLITTEEAEETPELMEI